MPRKTRPEYNFGPAPIGEVGLVDALGQDITDEDNQSVRATIVKDEFEVDVKNILQEQSLELKRIRRATELVLGEDVGEPED